MIQGGGHGKKVQALPAPSSVALYAVTVKNKHIRFVPSAGWNV